MQYWLASEPARYSTCKILWPSIKNCLRYPQSKICAPEQVGRSSPNSLKTYYPLIPLKLHQDRSNQLEEKRYKFFTPFNILAPQGESLGQTTPVWVVGYTVHQPPLTTCKISSRSDDPFLRYLLPNFVILLPASRRDPQNHKKHTEIDMSPRVG